MQTTTPYAHIRTEGSSNLVPKLTECSHFNSLKHVALFFDRVSQAILICDLQLTVKQHIAIWAITYLSRNSFPLV